MGTVSVVEAFFSVLVTTAIIKFSLSIQVMNLLRAKLL